MSEWRDKVEDFLEDSFDNYGIIPDGDEFCGEPGIYLEPDQGFEGYSSMGAIPRRRKPVRREDLIASPGWDFDW